MCFIQQPIHLLIKVQSIFSRHYVFYIIAYSSPDQSPIYFQQVLCVCTLAHSCLFKVQSIFSNRRRLFFTRCSSSKEALTTFIYYSILRNFRPTCLRASSRVCCYFWLMTSSAAGLFVLARVTSLFFVSTCSMCVCDD